MRHLFLVSLDSGWRELTLTDVCWTKFLEAMVKEVARRGDLKKVMDIVNML